MMNTKQTYLLWAVALCLIGWTAVASTVGAQATIEAARIQRETQVQRLQHDADDLMKLQTQLQVYAALIKLLSP